MSLTNNENTDGGAPTNPKGKPRPNRILVVDDEPSITRLLKLNLEKTGKYVVRAENGAVGALAAAEEFCPNLILLDVAMPGMDGGELARRIKLSPKLDSVPIVFLTALTTKDEVSKSHGLIGGQFFLAKPVNMQEVLACLDQHLAA